VLFVTRMVIVGLTIEEHALRRRDTQLWDWPHGVGSGGDGSWKVGGDAFVCLPALVLLGARKAEACERAAPCVVRSALPRADENPPGESTQGSGVQAHTAAPFPLPRSCARIAKRATARQAAGKATPS